MKLKGISKLVLAGTALAATAATLTTATYAWYVTNAEVEATGVSGSVASTSTGSLYIAENRHNNDADTPAEYSTELKLTKAVWDGTNEEWTASDIANGHYTFDELIPQSKAKADVYSYTRATEYAAQTTYYEIKNGAYAEAATAPTDQTNFATTELYTKGDKTANQGEWVDDKGKTLTDGPTLISFKFWLKSVNGGNVDVKFTVDNTTSDSFTGTQLAMAGTGLPDGVASGEAFMMDAVHALRMSVVKTEYNATPGTATTTYKAATGTFDSTKLYYSKSGTEESYTYTLVDTSDSNNFKEGITDMTTYFVVDTVTAGTTSYTVKPDVSAQDATQDNPEYHNNDTHVYQVDQVAVGVNGLKYQTVNSTAVAENNLALKDGGDANKYYKAVTQKAPYGTNVSDGTSTDNTTGETSWGTISLGAGVNTLLTFDIWLEGSDQGCWDSCRGQSFTFDFKFSLHTS